MSPIKNTNTILFPSTGQTKFFINYSEDDGKIKQKQKQTHIHSECEIYVNISGDVSFEVENQIYPVKKGDVIITKPYEYHHCIVHSDEVHKHYWILFEPEGDHDISRLFLEREARVGNLIHLDDFALTDMLRLFSVMLDSKKSALEHKIAFFQMMQLLESKKSVSNLHKKKQIPKNLIAVLTYMDEHLSESIDIKAIAEECFMSVNTLERHFKNFFGESPSAVLRKKRIVYSASLLRDGASVTEACDKCGFGDYCNYIAKFKALYGMTPLQYKKQAKQA